MKERSQYLDIVKGFAIILVVFGHCLQFGTFLYANDKYFENNLYQFIYSFHMPLFTLISGYLFYGSISRHSTKYNFRTRFTNLLIPILAWNTIHAVLINAKGIIAKQNIPWLDILSSYFTSTWFLWAIFWCSLVMLAINKLCKDNIVVYLVVIAVSILLPNDYNISNYVYMLPYFVIGYLWNKHHNKAAIESFTLSKKTILQSIVILFFVALIPFYQKEDFIYTSGTCIIEAGHKVVLNQLFIDMYRFAIGLFGALSALIALKLASPYLGNISTTILSNLGRKSIGIYIISTTFINLSLSKIPHANEFGYLIAIIETLIILFTTYIITYLLSKNKITKKILLGSR